ncbi:MAG TPA: site-2 protease family protein [Gemmatimonadaceae bacterium]|nr:site-2 protease family protein [Gemmatimonadaceae bacterium]
MKWSWKIGRIGGIDLRVHATFFILLAWLALVDYRESGSAVGAIGGLVFTLALFASVVLHEFGHALTGRRFGVPTRDITLLPIGGVARLEYIPENPRQELAIALAGPAVTLAIALVLYAIARLASFPVSLTALEPQRGAGAAFLVQLMWVNVSLLVFNLLPAFPMDGGRVLRALLAFHWPYARATHMAARVGKAFALLFGIVGLMYNPFLVLIALFVWLGAAAESSGFQEHSILSGVAVDRVMVRDVETLAPDDTLDAALRHVLDGFQHDFPVVRDGVVVGVLTRDALLAGLARGGPALRVADAMDASFRTAEPGEPAERALARLRECHCHTLPVLANGRLAGVITAENLAEYVMIAAALHEPRRGSAAA